MAYKGNEIVNVARTCIGKKYASSFNGYAMDCSGLVAYCLYKTLGIKKATIGTGCKQQWNYFSGRSHKGTVLYQSSSMSGKGKNISSSQVKAGDLLYKFFYDGGQNHHVMIATGSGKGTVDASGGAGVVREKSSYPWAFQDVDLWVRMYEDGAQSSTTTTVMQQEASNPTTSSGQSPISTGNVQSPAPSSPVITSATDSSGNPSSSGSSQDTSSSADVTSQVSYDYSYLLAGGLPLTSVDTYKGAMTSILANIKSTKNLVYNGATLLGKSLGFLYDLTHGGSFKFILPEFSESYNANYEVINIPGRSSDIQSYSGTSSPQRSVSLQLMAGEGLYKGSDPVTDLHKDLAFLKSLLYPDYNSSVALPPAIVLLYLGPKSVLKGVMTTCSINMKKPYTVDGIPMYAEVSFTITQASDDPPDYKDVRSQSTVAY